MTVTQICDPPLVTLKTLCYVWRWPKSDFFVRNCNPKSLYEAEENFFCLRCPQVIQSYLENRNSVI